MDGTSQVPNERSIIRGVPISEGPPFGALTLPGFLREVTTRFADREALVLRTRDDVVRWTYTMLWDRAFEVARALTACGVDKDSRVGVLMTNRPEWLAATFGIGLAGGVAVALSTFSTQEELEYLLQASGVSILLFERQVAKKDFATMLVDLEPQIGSAKPSQIASTKLPYLRRCVMVGEPPSGGAIEGWSDFLACGSKTAPELVDARAAAVRPSDTGLLFFSSGSTSRPKGVLSAHRSATTQFWRWPWILNFDDDEVRSWTPNGFFWSGNFAMSLGATLAAGGSLVLQPVFDPEEALELFQSERVTFPQAWPHQWAHLEAAPNFHTVDVSSLKYCDMRTPASKLPTFKPAGWVEPIWAYGNTETFTLSTVFRSGTPPEIIGNSHGVPLPGMTIKVVDPHSGNVVPRGERGEIAVKGVTLMIGYIGVTPDDTFDDEGFFHTGDGGYIDEQGRLFWEGRLTDIIKTGGANVSPVEVDAVLAQCPGVKAGMTVGIPHDTLGELVVSCIVAQADAQIDEASVCDFLKQRLASYKVPRRVLFFREDELALTGSNKIKSGSLRDLVAERLKPTLRFDRR